MKESSPMSKGPEGPHRPEPEFHLTLHRESIGMNTKPRLIQQATALLFAALATVTSGLAGATPKPEAGIGLPRDVSQHGHHIDWLIEVTMVFVVILFIIMVIWMLWAVFAHNEKHT